MAMSSGKTMNNRRKLIVARPALSVEKIGPWKVPASGWTPKGLCSNG
jgi:hypothetical protein